MLLICEVCSGWQREKEHSSIEKRGAGEDSGPRKCRKVRSIEKVPKILAQYL